MAIEQGFYKLNKILSLKDKDGKDPQIYFICGNRGPGKTFAVKHYFLKRFINYDEKFIILRREVQELDGCGNNFFKDISIKFTNYDVYDKSVNKGQYFELWLKKKDEEGEGRCMGYVLAINSSNKIRTLAPNFTDAERIFFDEFQAEDAHYLGKEITKFISVLTSVSRGKGKTYRYVPAFLCSNNVSIVNPYFTAFHVKPDSDTNFLRGKGWVYEQVRGYGAAKAIEDSPLGALIEGSNYADYALGGKYLSDNDGFIEEVKGDRLSVCTIICDGVKYGVWSMKEGDYAGMYYVNHKYNENERNIVTFSIADHKPGSLLTIAGSLVVKNLKNMFNNGYMYFDDQESKNVVIEMIGLQQINK